MTTPIIITLCTLLILAYVFDVTAPKTKIPSVILLLMLGWLVQKMTNSFGVSIPDLQPILPIFGTIGLILIVLEGSLELDIDRSKLSFVFKAAMMALVPMVLLSLGIAYALQYFGGIAFKDGLSNAIPLAVISSSIAIPSAQGIGVRNKEFVTYESSLSDIFGVIFFNFFTLNDTVGIGSVAYFSVEVIAMLLITFLATIGLSFLLSKIKHHVKFIPIILMIVIVYVISKEYHLPALIFIMILGIFLGNIDKLKSVGFMHQLHPEVLTQEVHKLKELTTEITFLIRALFFLLFGYLIKTSELFNTQTIIWSLSICLGIFAIRFVFLKLFKLNAIPLLFIAPRGLITILLFLSVPVTQQVALVNKSLIIQIIILSALFMMFGFMISRKGQKRVGNNS